MAKRQVSEQGNEFPRGQPTQADSRLEGFAEDLGRLLGTAKAKAEGWMGQRQNVAKQLEQIRDTAASLLTQLGDVTIRRRGRRPEPQGARKKAQGPRATASGAYPRKKFSAATIAKMRASQKARWAKKRKENEE